MGRSAILAVVACAGALMAALAVSQPRVAPASTSATSSRLSLVEEPQAGVTPFIDMIDNARRSIELTMYELTDTNVEQALVAAQQRGVDVRVALNGAYHDESDTTNQAAYDYLSHNGVSVRYTPTYFALTHQKTLTVDGTESAIMTLNLDGQYATTRDFAVLDRQPADVSAIVQTFDDDWNRTRDTPSTGTGDLIWSPGAQDSFTSLINGAMTSIDVENEEMDDSTITDDLCDAAQRGVDVRIVMTAESDWDSALHQLVGCGAQVSLSTGQSDYIHAKILVVDGSSAIVSSQNDSDGSMDDNRELGIEVTDPTILSQLSSDFDSDFSGATPDGGSSGSERPQPTTTRRLRR